MTAGELRDLCVRLPGAIEDFPFGEQPSVFKVGGKMFALSTLPRRPLQVSVKCDPDLGAELRGTYPAIAAGYHLNKRHWLTVTLDGTIPHELVSELVGGSYDLVVGALPQRVREALELPNPNV